MQSTFYFENWENLFGYLSKSLLDFPYTKSTKIQKIFYSSLFFTFLKYVYCVVYTYNFYSIILHKM